MPRYTYQYGPLAGKTELMGLARYEQAKREDERIAREKAEEEARAALPKRNPILNIRQAGRINDDGKLITRAESFRLADQMRASMMKTRKRWRDRLNSAKRSIEEWAAEKFASAQLAKERLSKLQQQKRQAEKQIKIERWAYRQVGLFRGENLPEANANFQARFAWESRLEAVLEGQTLLVPNPNGEGAIPADTSEGFAKLHSMDKAHESTFLGTPVWVKTPEGFVRLHQFTGM